MLSKQEEIIASLMALVIVIVVGLAVHNFYLLERRVFWAEKLAHSTWNEVQELSGRIEALELEAGDE